MYLKKIDIQGFKSFADRITIELDRGVTSIVGPNGSGKSNISDAVRWVLGEQSVRSLRGSRMEDVIFSGTEHRKPSGFAEVTLLIDNDGGRLPIPFTEVSVTRRVYRSGESEYLINRRLCRLKDVNELFFDTGVGREGYTIIGQGKVDEILSNKPDERRGIFEEAAGISKYKARRQEAERKLEATSQNLLRIGDIIGELGVQLEILEEQAGAAGRYLKLRAELESIEVAGYVSLIGKFEAELQKYETGLAAVKEEHARHTALLSEIEASSSRLRERAEQIEAQQAALNAALIDIEARHSAFSNQINLNTEKTNRAVSDIERVRAEIARAGERKSGYEAELAASQKKHAYLSAELERYENLLSEKKALYDGILSVIDAADREIEQKKQEASDARDRCYELKNRLTGLAAEREHYGRAATALEKNLASVIGDLDGGSLAREELDDQRNAIKADINRLHKLLSALSQKRADTGAQIDAAKPALAALGNEINAKRARLKILSDMEDSFEGFYASVRRVLTECKRTPGFGEGVCGAVASLIKTPAELETAVGMALGPALQNIVTDGEPAAARAIAFLKKTSGGRATFLPISSVRGRRLDAGLPAKLAKMSGYIGVASELIEYDEKYNKVMSELLGATVVVDRLDNGLAVASAFRHMFRIVTLDGDIISVGGSITGGSLEQRGTGILGRNREIKELASSLAALQDRLTARQREYVALESKLGAIVGDMSAQESAQNERRLEEAALTQRLSGLDDKLKADAERRGLYALELDEAARAAAGLDAQIGELSAAIEAGLAGVDIMQREIGAYTEKNREGQQYRDELLSDISAYNVSVASVSEARKAVSESIGRLEAEMAGSDRGISAREEAVKRFYADIEQYKMENEAFRAELDKIEMERRGSRLRGESAEAEKAALRTESARLTDEAARVGSLLGGVVREMGRFETREARIRAELDHNRNRLWEDYELTYHNALESLPGGAQAFLNDDTGEAAAKRSAAIRDEMRELGPVNVLSIEEFKQTKVRFDKMEEQKNDLEDAGVKLRRVISEMSQIMSRNFAEHFDHINKNFDIVFKELFSGGRARLILTEGSDVLEAGVEIEIQLPGKRMQNMMLYSGGERALTAIALIFALLMLRPAPFCLLDEIESSLDDANVDRFSRYIKKYSEETQFILVTHRKGTMEGSNVLYGVTMQERGVSDVVSLNLGSV